jgi:putative transposase
VTFAVSCLRACHLAQFSRAAWYRRSQAKDQTALRRRIRELAHVRLRDERLNVHQFTSIEDAKAKIEAWRVDYNQRRPRSSLRHLTPNEFVAQRQAVRTVEAAALSR